jgi:hypothetical protein
MKFGMKVCTKSCQVNFNFVLYWPNRIPILHDKNGFTVQKILTCDININLS